jgi:hypothetical protein
MSSCLRSMPRSETVPQRPVSRAISCTWQLDYDTWEHREKSQRCQCGAYTGRVVYLLFLYWRSPPPRRACRVEKEAKGYVMRVGIGRHGRVTLDEVVLRISDATLRRGV